MLPPVSGVAMIIDYDDRHNRHCSNLQPSRHDTSLHFLFLIVMLTEDPFNFNCDVGRQEFWNADTGEIICNMTAAYGDEK